MSFAKEFITNKMTQLASEKYDLEFDELPITVQQDIYTLACMLYRDYLTNLIDRALELARER